MSALFHPLIQRWFEERFSTPTAAQREGCHHDRHEAQVEAAPVPEAAGPGPLQTQRARRQVDLRAPERGEQVIAAAAEEPAARARTRKVAE